MAMRFCTTSQEVDFDELQHPILDTAQPIPPAIPGEWELVGTGMAYGPWQDLYDRPRQHILFFWRG